VTEFKEKYPKVPNSNQWGVALATVASFMSDLQHAVKRIDHRVAKLEIDSESQEADNDL
jgi:hypothetical protein